MLKLNLIVSPMLDAISIYGDIKKVPKNKFRFRVSGYAIIIHDKKILLVNTRSSGKWFFPGGEVEIGEKIEDTVKREVKEETGIDIEVKNFLTFKETFFYYDPRDEGYHNYSLFFICQPLSFDLSEEFQPDFDEAEKPEWVEMSKLKNEDFQPPAAEVFELIKQKE